MFRALFALWLAVQPAAPLVFQNNFSVNLHQFLHAEASRRAAGRQVEMDGALLDAYAPIATRDTLRDLGLIALNDALSQVTGETLPATIDPAVAAVLGRAAPIYREKFWPQHRSANEVWIAAARPEVDRLAPALTAKLAGDMAIETVFHEASHLVGGGIIRMINEEARRQNVRASANLWHAMIFYTTGEPVRREIGKVGDAHYMPYAYRFNVYAKGMDKDRAALERDWQPYLGGKIAYEEALKNLVRDATR